MQSSCQFDKSPYCRITNTTSATERNSTVISRKWKHKFLGLLSGNGHNMNMDGAQVFVASPPLVFVFPHTWHEGQRHSGDISPGFTQFPAAVCGGVLQISFPEVASLYEVPKFKERAFWLAAETMFITSANNPLSETVGAQWHDKLLCFRADHNFLWPETKQHSNIPSSEPVLVMRLATEGCPWNQSIKERKNGQDVQVLTLTQPEERCSPRVFVFF